MTCAGLGQLEGSIPNKDLTPRTRWRGLGRNAHFRGDTSTLRPET